MQSNAIQPNPIQSIPYSPSVLVRSVSDGAFRTRRLGADPMELNLVGRLGRRRRRRRRRSRSWKSKHT
jgi:hypothetical protein